MLRSTIATLCLAATALGAPATPATSAWKISLDFLEGTLQGFSNASTPKLEACASTSINAYDEIKDAIAEIEQKTLPAVAAGIRDLSKAYKNLKVALVECKVAEAEVARFFKTIEDNFEHPASFLFHVGKELIINGRDIYTEMSAAVADWKANSFRAAGIEIGHALAKLLVPTFEAWKLVHGKVYSSVEEEASARSTYLLNTDLVNSMHLQHAAGVYYHLNEFADLAPSVFNKRNGYIPGARPRATHMHRLSGEVAPTSLDWRTKGLVADVKNQGQARAPLARVDPLLTLPPDSPP